MEMNLYQNLIFAYTDAISHITDNIDKRITSKIDDRKSIFGKKSNLFIDINKYQFDNIKFDFDYINSTLTDKNSDLVIWTTLVSQFADFLPIAEKCFMYRNSDECHVYSEYDEKASTKYLYFIPNKMDIKIKVTFENSVINIPELNSLLSYIEGYDSAQDTVVFVKVEIEREFGSEMKNEFNYIQGSGITFNNDTDERLFKTLRLIISDMIFDCFIDIIDNYAMKFEYVKDIKIKDVLENGIRVCRCDEELS